MDFSFSKEEWYALRDDRTNRILEKKLDKEFSVGIIIDPAVSKSYELQCMTLVLCNILSRWCRKITIDSPDCTLIASRHGGKNLKKYLLETMAKIDPHGNFTFGNIDDCTFILSIGDTKITKPHFWIDASGWIGGCGYGKTVSCHKTSNKNPVGPTLASCMGAAMLFEHAVCGLEQKESSIFYSLFDYSSSESPHLLINPEVSESLDLGNICQIGCGAVGSSLDYLLSISEFHGNLQLIDFDIVKYENCNCSLSFNSSDKGQKKTDVCESILQSENISVLNYPKSYNDFTSEKNFSAYNPDIILCLANERNVWITIQNNFPALVLHATTSPNWAINFGRHGALTEWCTMCRFSDQIDKKFDGQCGSGIINKSANDIILGNLPFLSPCAAIFVLAEILRLNIGTKANSNFVYFPLKHPFTLNKRFHNKRKDCVCKTQLKDVFDTLRQDTKFYALIQQ